MTTKMTLDQATVLIALLRRRVNVLEKLAACYRYGSQPSERVLTELTVTRDAIAEYDRA